MVIVSKGQHVAGAFLIVDDSELVLRALSHFLDRYAACSVAQSVADAKRSIDDRRDWLGFIIDAHLPDGSGLELLRDARAIFGRTPSIMYSGELDPVIVNGAASLNARVLHKPFGLPELSPFLADALGGMQSDRVPAVLEKARADWALSKRETEVLGAALHGQSREEFVKAAGVTFNTYKTLTRRLLDKAGYENLASLAIDLLRGH